MTVAIESNAEGYYKSLDYNLYWANDRGERIAEIEQAISLNYVKSVHNVGYFELVVPYDKLFQRGRDYQLQIWRKPYGSDAYRFDFMGFARKFRKSSSGGNPTLAIHGFDPMYLLSGRIVAYYAQSAQAVMTDNAGDIMKEIVRDNAIDNADYGGSSLSPSRALTDFSVAPNLGDGTSITRAFSWDNLLQALQETFDASVTAGTRVYFGIETVIGGNNKPNFLFYTSTGQPGADRTDKKFSFENGSIADAEWVEDYSEEITAVYAGGQGTEDNRLMSKQTSARANASRYAVREAFQYATMAETSAALDSEAYKRLNEGRPREMLQATIQDSDLMRYQLDWNVGDKVGYDVLDEQGEEIIHSVAISLDQNGERLTARLEHGAMMGKPEERIAADLSKLRKRLMKLESREDTIYKGRGSSVPTTTELPRNGMFYLYSNIARRAYFNDNGTIVYATLST